MTRVVLVADTGAALADLTAAAGSVPGGYIVRHVSGTAPLDRLVAPLAPDLVVVGDLVEPAHALARLAEARGVCPEAAVVAVSSAPAGGWLAAMLHAQATALVPAGLQPAALGALLRAVAAGESPVSPLRSVSAPAAVPAGAAA